LIGPIHLINNKYRLWYFQIIDRAHDRMDNFQGEFHHQLPRAFGGLNSACVKLTFQEHFLCHWLLTKFTDRDAKRKMCYALNLMTRGTKKHATRIASSWQYEIGKKSQAAAMIGNMHTIGQKRDVAFRARRREIMLGNTNTKGHRSSEETKAKVRASLRGNRRNAGNKASAETKERMRQSHLDKKHTAATLMKMREASLRRIRNSDGTYIGTSP